MSSKNSGCDNAVTGAVTRTEFGHLNIGEPDSDSGRGGSSPRPEGFLAEDAERAAGCEIALDVESVLDGGVNGQEPLRGTWRFEALHLALASSHRQMRVLGPIVFAQALFMASAQSHFRFCRRIRAQLVSDQHLRREALFLELQLAHQFHRCSLVAPTLHKQIENLAFVVDRAPQPELPAANNHGHLVEMPPGAWPRASTAKLPGEYRPELQDPSPHRFVGAIQPTLSQQVFDRDS